MLGAGEAMPQGWLNQGMKQPAYPLTLLGLGEASREVQGHFFGVAPCTRSPPAAGKALQYIGEEKLKS